MAATVVKGVYATKTALDTAEKETASAGDAYLVGSGAPYDIYTFKSSAFSKTGTMSDKATDLGASVDDLYKMSFTAADGKTLKVRKGLHIGEIHLYVPAA